MKKEMTCRWNMSSIIKPEKVVWKGRYDISEIVVWKGI